MKKKKKKKKEKKKPTPKKNKMEEQKVGETTTFRLYVKCSSEFCPLPYAPLTVCLLISITLNVPFQF